MARIDMLRSNGTWLPIHTPPGCAPETTIAASTLARYLDLMGSPEPRVSTADGSPAIVVGTTSDLTLHGWTSWYGPPHLSGDCGWTAIGPSLFVWGTDAAALTAAVWRLLDRLGYAYLRPHPDWERIPKAPPSVEVTDYSTTLRRFTVPPGRDGGLMADQVAAHTDWALRQGIRPDWTSYQYGHVWNLLIQEAGWPTDGIRVSTVGNKLATFDPQVEGQARTHARTTMAAGLLGVSLSAADGSAGWPESLVTGEGRDHPPADRQQHLAYVGQAEVGDAATIVTMIYGDSTYPALTPGTPIDPRQTVLVVNAYRKGGRTVQEIAADYAGRCTVGSYEQDAWQWGYGRPGYGVYGTREQIASLQARIQPGPLVAQGCDTWGARGRGFWAVAGDEPLARWDRYPATAFPSAPAQAEIVCSLLDSATLLTTDWLHRAALAVQDLIAAIPISATSERACAFDVAAHVVAMHHMHAYQIDPTAATLEPWLIWASRLWRSGRWVEPMRLPYYDGAWSTALAGVALKYMPCPAGVDPTTWKPILSPGPNLPWPMPTVTQTEIALALTQVIALDPPQPFQTRTWDYSDLVLSTTVDGRNRGAFGSYSKNPISVWIASDTDRLALTGRGCCATGAVGDCLVKVYDDQDVLVATLVAPTGSTAKPFQTVPVIPRRIYRLEYGQAQGTQVLWPDTYWAAYEMRETAVSPFVSSLIAYVYVADLTPIGLFVGGSSGTLSSPDGTTVYNLVAGYNVLPSTAVGWWRIRNVSGLTWIGTHPALVSLHPSEGILPRGLGAI